MQSAIAEVFTPWKLANTINQGFPPKEPVIKHLPGQLWVQLWDNSVFPKPVKMSEHKIN